MKRKWRGRRQERPGSPPQQVETEAQPAETLNATQETPPGPPSQRRHPSQTPAQEEKARRAKRSRDRTETRAIFILFAGSFSSKLLKKEMHTIAVLLLFVYL